MNRQWRLRVGTRAVAAVLLALVAGNLAAGTSHAAEPDDLWVQHCGTFTETGQTICVPQGEDLHAEVERLTGTRIVDAATEDASRSSQAASYLVVRFFKDGPNQGTQWDYFSTTACTGPVKNYSSFFIGGNDAVSAFAGYSGCEIELYENTNFGGVVLPYAAVRNSLGIMNDKASSFRAR